MALRSTHDESSNSPVPGLNYFWQEAEKEPSYDWEQWQQLFEVAVLARHSISVTEITRTGDEQNPCVPALMGNLKENASARKIVSLLYISLGKNGRKMIMVKFSQITSCLFSYPNSCNIAMNASKREEIELWIDIRFCQESRSRTNPLTSSGMLQMDWQLDVISAIRQKV